MSWGIGSPDVSLNCRHTALVVSSSSRRADGFGQVCTAGGGGKTTREEKEKRHMKESRDPIRAADSGVRQRCVVTCWADHNGSIACLSLWPELRTCPYLALPRVERAHGTINHSLNLLNLRQLMSYFCVDLAPPASPSAKPCSESQLLQLAWRRAETRAAAMRLQVLPAVALARTTLPALQRRRPGEPAGWAGPTGPPGAGLLDDLRRDIQQAGCEPRLQPLSMRQPSLQGSACPDTDFHRRLSRLRTLPLPPDSP